MQTKLESFIEAWINVVIGFWINFIANWVILRAMGFDKLTLGTNVVIGLLFTIISVARSYVIRRWAQVHLRRVVKAIAGKIKRNA